MSSLHLEVSPRSWQSKFQQGQMQGGMGFCVCGRGVERQGAVLKAPQGKMECEDGGGRGREREVGASIPAVQCGTCNSDSASHRPCSSAPVGGKLD